MTTDEQVVQESDLALIRATEAYKDTPVWERPQLSEPLRRAREHWATARYRLLFPGTISTQADVQAARGIRARVETAADKQQMAQALLDLVGLLIKFAH